MNRKIIRTLLIIIAIFGFIFIIRSIGQCSSGEKDIDMAKVIDKHCETDFKGLDSFFKEGLLIEFAENPQIQIKSMGRTVSDIANELLQNSVKYPQTLEIGDEKGKTVWIRKANSIDRNKNEIVFSQRFTSENKLGIRVHSQFWLTIFYPGKCDPAQVVDFQIE